MDTKQQLERLWQYQTADLEIDKIENVLRNSELRQELARTVAYLKEQQAAVQKMEASAQEIRQKLDLVTRDLEDSVRQYDESRSEPFETLNREQLAQIRQRSAAAADVMARREREVAKLVEQLQKQAKLLDEMKVKVARAKKDYPVLKARYDDEVAKLAEQTAPMKRERDKIGETIDRELLKRYNNIKGRRSNPIARVVDQKCAGCNMTIAQFVLGKAKDTGTIVECENCGRILYID